MGRAPLVHLSGTPAGAKQISRQQMLFNQPKAVHNSHWHRFPFEWVSALRRIRQVGLSGGLGVVAFSGCWLQPGVSALDVGYSCW